MNRAFIRTLWLALRHLKGPSLFTKAIILFALTLGYRDLVHKRKLNIALHECEDSMK